MESRKQEIKTERRRRNSDGIAGRNKKLSVREEDLDREKYEYRFVNDTGNRVHNLYQQDWDVVDSKDARVAGTHEDGSPQKAVLMRKPKDYYRDDEKLKQQRIDEQEKAIASGGDPNGEADGGTTYVPSKGKALTIG